MEALRETMGGGCSDSSSSAGEEDFNFRLFPVREETGTGGQEERKGDDPPPEHGSEDGGGSQVEGRIDRDQEESEDVESAEEHLEAIPVTNGEARDGEDEEDTARGKAPSQDAQTYAALSKATIDKLPTGERVVELVGQGLRRHWLGREERFKDIVVALLSLPAVQAAIRGWWQFLVETLVENSDQPPTSARALLYEMARREKRRHEKNAFSHDRTIVAKVVELQGNSHRVTHLLISVFLAIDEVADKTLVQELDKAHFINVTYPTHDVEIDIHQRRIVFHLGGWLLSRALTRVSRQKSRGPQFLPFVNSHKFPSADAFRDAHPEFSGLEFLVEERNVEWKGKGLLFPSAAFYRFVRALEVGYRSVMLNPALLATYLGDLPSEVMRVNSEAGPVRATWARCVRVVTDPLNGPVWGEGGTKECQELFDFFLMRWHNVRFHAYAKELKDLKQKLKHRRAEMALRDRLKAGAGGRRVNPKRTTKPKEPIQYTVKQRARQIELNQAIGSQAWGTLTCEHLREFIVECGGKPKANMNKSELKKMFRALVPRAGIDNDPALAARRPQTFVPENWSG